MILKNWYNAWKASHAEIVMPNGIVGQDGSIIDASYNVSNMAVYGLAMVPNAVVYSSATSGIYLGRGTTPPTFDDYKMEDMITSGVNCTVSVEYNDNYDAVNIITITNNSGAEITIGEVGRGGHVYTTIKWIIALLDRTVLDEPVTIPAGGVGQVTYTIRMNYPTA